MFCRDAQFYLRLRRHAGDELGADVTLDLGRHLAGCAACAADARGAESFDRAVASAMRTMPVPGGLRDRLLTQASTYRGGVIRRTAIRYAALAASLFFGVGLAFGVFSATRPKIDPDSLVARADDQVQRPDELIRQWLTAQKFNERLPEPFNPYLLMHLGTERVQGVDVPVAVFRHPTEPGFAKVYIFRTDGTFNLNDLRETNASHTMATVLAADPRVFRGAKYVVVHTVHQRNHPNDKPFQAFLSPPGEIARG